MDHLHNRLETLEQQVQTLTQHTRTATTRLRWWRGIACSLMVLGLLGWGLPVGLAREDGSEKDKDQKGLAHRVAALEKLLKHFSREGNEIFITGANLHIVNGLDATTTTNGLGNLIVGYNEPRVDADEGNIRTGSHNVVVGQLHNFSRFGGMVVGSQNTISGYFAVVTGGDNNTASGNRAVVSGGGDNHASGFFAVVSGGGENSANGGASVVSGGRENVAGGPNAVVSGGVLNTASSFNAVVSGGGSNTASGSSSSISGGGGITVEQEGGWAAGSSGDEISGSFRSP